MNGYQNIALIMLVTLIGLSVAEYWAPQARAVFWGED